MMREKFFLGIVFVSIHVFTPATQIQKLSLAPAVKCIISLPSQDLLFKERQNHYKRGLLNALKHGDTIITGYCELLYKQKKVRKERCSGCPCLKEYVKALIASENALKCSGFGKAYKTSICLSQEFREKCAGAIVKFPPECKCFGVPCKHIEIAFQSLKLFFPLVKKFWWPCLAHEPCNSPEKYEKYTEIKNFLQKYGADFFENVTKNNTKT